MATILILTSISIQSFWQQTVSKDHTKGLKWVILNIQAVNLLLIEPEWNMTELYSYVLHAE